MYCYVGNGSSAVDVLIYLYVKNDLGPLLLTWINFNPSMDK